MGVNISYLVLSSIPISLLFIHFARKNARIEFYVNSVLLYLCLAIVLVYGIIFSILTWPFALHTQTMWSVGRLYAVLARATTGVTVELVAGEEYLCTRPAVYIGNHQTELDIMLFGGIIPQQAVLTAKKSLKHVPLLGWSLALAGTRFLDRKNAGAARSVFEDAARSLHGRSSPINIFVFPEGTRSHLKAPDLLSFRKGAFHLAVQAQVPIVPIVMEHYADVVSVHERRLKSGSTFRAEGTVPWFKHLSCNTVGRRLADLSHPPVLKPIETAGLTPQDVDALCTQTRDAMLNRVHHMAKSKLWAAGETK